VDADGNERAGIRLPEVTVPLATYTGWNFRNAATGGTGQLVALLGSYIPLSRTKADREARKDPRPSIEERYPSFGQYNSAVDRAIDDLVKDRLMLCEDTDDQQARLLAAGLAAGVPAPNGNGRPLPIPHCQGRAGR